MCQLQLSLNRVCCKSFHTHLKVDHPRVYLQDYTRLHLDSVFNEVVCEFYNVPLEYVEGIRIRDCIFCKPYPRYNMLVFFLDYWKHFDIPRNLACALIKTIYSYLPTFYNLYLHIRDRDYVIECMSIVHG